MADQDKDLSGLYRELAAELARLSPICELSGRCCRFHEFDHTLFLSQLEFDYLMKMAPAPVRPLDEGATCPWQDQRGRCTAREGRPLGCRVYFCDPHYAPHAGGLSERFLGRLKILSDDLNLPWNYAPLHTHLKAAQNDGIWGPPHSDSGASKTPTSSPSGEETLDTSPSDQYC